MPTRDIGARHRTCGKIMQYSGAKHRIRTKFKHEAARYAEDLRKFMILKMFA
jgi:hypothetical protein